MFDNPMLNYAVMVSVFAIWQAYAVGVRRGRHLAYKKLAEHGVRNDTLKMES